MKEKNIRELAKRMGLITVEDMCQYTIAQLVVMVANKVNELVDEVWRFETDVQEILKTQNENIQYLLGEGLLLEVENIFNGWVQDGTFDTLINQTALKKVNDRIDETNAQLSELANKGTTVEVLERVTKEEIDRQIADGALANLTIEDNSITGDKLKLGTITPDKIYNTKPTEIKNLLDGVNVTPGCRYNNGVLEMIANYSISDFIPVSPGYDYTLNKGRHSLVSIFDSQKTFIKEEKVNGDAVDYNFTIPPKGRYVVVNMPADLINTMTLTNDLIGDYYTIDWLELKDESVGTRHIKTDSVTLNELSTTIFEDDVDYQYDFPFASTTHQRGYVVPIWIDISHLNGQIEVSASIDVRTNKDFITMFYMKFYQADTVVATGGKGSDGSQIPYTSNDFATISRTDFITKDKKYLLVYLWGVGNDAVTPATILFKNIDIRLNGVKQTITQKNIGVYDLNNANPTLSIISTGSKPVVASKEWVIDCIDDRVGITTKNRIQGKRLGVIGDSYVYGHTLGPTKSWVAILGERNNMTYFNYGVNGGMISGVNGVAERYINMGDDLDYVVVFGGHNDATNAVPIGNDTDSNVTTFKGSLNVLCKGLLTKYPRARILFMTPSHRKGNEIPYCQAMKDICYKYGIQVYDTYGKLGINIGDGDEGNAEQKAVFELVPLHLNELGNEYLSYKVESELLTL